MPEVVDFPFVPVTVIISLFIYLGHWVKKSGQIFRVSIPTNEVPEDLFNILIQRSAHCAITSDK